MDRFAPWPIEEVFYRPILTVALAVLLPFVTARILALLLLPRPGALAATATSDERARWAAPFRTAAFVVGVVQVQLVAFLGETALGPALVASPRAAATDVFSIAVALVAFVAGGVARRIESQALGLEVPTAFDAALLRLRMAAYLGGPMLGWFALRTVEVVRVGDEGVRVDVVALLVVVASMVVLAAVGGVVVGRLTFALRPATPRVRAIAERAAAREGLKLWAVLRLPTRSVPFANAAAIPWARAMVVTDRLADRLDDEALDAVLAHEAGHLAEPAGVLALRLAPVVALLAALLLGPALLELPDASRLEIAVPVSLVLAGAAWFVARRYVALARRMEERADQHALRHAGGAALARALRMLHEDALAPMTTGRRRVHPDLYDRLAACGEALPERPLPVPTRNGRVAGVIVAALLVALPWLAETVTVVDVASAPELGADAAWRRLHVDPWDANATLALAWDARHREDLERSGEYLAAARHVGVAEPEALELEAELLAARGFCDEARATFDRALEARLVDPLRTSLVLGGYRLPRSLVTECGMGSASSGDW